MYKKFKIYLHKTIGEYEKKLRTTSSNKTGCTKGTACFYAIRFTAIFPQVNQE